MHKTLTNARGGAKLAVKLTLAAELTYEKLLMLAQSQMLTAKLTYERFANAHSEATLVIELAIKR